MNDPQRFILRGAALAVLFALITFLCGAPARASISSVEITNKSTNCAWITIYWAPNFYIPYMIAERNDAERPQFLRPGQTHLFPVAGVAEMKIRAEVTKNADCTGGTIKDTYDVRKNDNPDQGLRLKAHLMNTSNGYNLWYY